MWCGYLAVGPGVSVPCSEEWSHGDDKSWGVAPEVISAGVVAGSGVSSEWVSKGYLVSCLSAAVVVIRMASGGCLSVCEVEVTVDYS